jgi:deoxyhypusine synthase
MTFNCEPLAVKEYFADLVGKPLDEEEISDYALDLLKDFCEGVSEHVENTFQLDYDPAQRRKNLKRISDCVADSKVHFKTDADITRAFDVIHQQVRSNSHRFIEKINEINKINQICHDIETTSLATPPFTEF